MITAVPSLVRIEKVARGIIVGPVPKNYLAYEGPRG